MIHQAIGENSHRHLLIFGIIPFSKTSTCLLLPGTIDTCMMMSIFNVIMNGLGGPAWAFLAMTTRGIGMACTLWHLKIHLTGGNLLWVMPRNINGGLLMNKIFGWAQ